ncbi:MAG: GtrA family protein [Deltaproteobacteria bacterium]|nr:GtrA family protein [Deltaproteobacteria bacterium]
MLRWSGEFIRYVVVGVATNVFGFLLYVLVTSLGVSPVGTISILYPVHIGLAFCLNRKWSFSHRGRISTTALKYLMAYIGCYASNVALLQLLNGILGYSHVIAQAVAVLLIALLLFALQKFWVFREQGASVPRPQTS